MSNQNPAGNGAAARVPMRLSLRILLVVSLTLNLIVAGLVLGAFLHGPDRDLRPNTALNDIGLGPFVGALPPEARKAVGRALVERAGSLRENREKLRAQLDDLLAVLRGDPFDMDKLRTVVEAQRADLSARAEIGRDIVFAEVARMSVEERRAYADAIERGFARGPRFRDRH